jgi:hypothetical protein
MDGELAAVQVNGGTPVLQLHDLQGNVVATAALSETETKLLSTYQSSEFGVPTSSKPPKYSWLGGSGIAAQLPSSGIVATGGGAYVPEVGRPLETGSVMPPALGAGSVSAIETPWSSAELKALEKGKADEMAAEQQKAAEEELKKKQEEEFHCGSCEIRPNENLPSPEGGGVTVVETTQLGSRAGNPEASAAFDKSFKIPKWAAGVLGWLILTSQQLQGDSILGGMVHLPSYFVTVINNAMNHKTGGELTKIGLSLVKASQLAVGWVTITVTGTPRLYEVTVQYTIVEGE